MNITLNEKQVNTLVEVVRGAGKGLLELDKFSEVLESFYDKDSRKYDKGGFKALIINTPELDKAFTSSNINTDTAYIYARLKLTCGAKWRELGKGWSIALESTAKELGIKKFNKALEGVDISKYNINDKESKLALVNAIRKNGGLGKKSLRKASNNESSRAHELTKEEYKVLVKNLGEALDKARSLMDKGELSVFDAYLKNKGLDGFVSK